jgi:hypothetical protein
MKPLSYVLLLLIPLLAGCITDTIPRAYENSERLYPQIPGQSAPYEVWMTTRGSSRWVMFADVTRSTCDSAIIEFKRSRDDSRRKLYDLKKSGLYQPDQFPGFLGCTEKVSFWYAPNRKIISIIHATGEVHFISYDHDIFWADRKWSPKDDHSIIIQTRDGIFILRPETIKTEPNQSLQTMTTAVTDCAAHTPRQLRSCLI